MSDVSNIQGLAALPSEILLNVLALLETQQLLRLTLVSHRFHLLILRILHARVLLAAPPLGFELILECYRPAAKYTEPQLDCEYIGTDGLEDILAGGQLDATSLGGELRKINRLYSRFRPYRRTEPRPRRHPAGDIPGSRTYARSIQAQQQQRRADAQSSQSVTYPRPQAPESNADTVVLDANSHNESSREAASSKVASDSPEKPTTVTLPIHLDDSELFTQLCAHVTLVVPGPKKGIYRTTALVHDCIIRVWRHWLAKEAQSVLRVQENEEELVMNGDSNRNDKEKASARLSSSSSLILDERGILWSNKSREICMRFKVRKRRWRQEHGENEGGNHGITARNIDLTFDGVDNDDMPVTYELEFQELLVRTSHILFKMEEARTRLHDSTGKAMVFGQFAS